MEQELLKFLSQYVTEGKKQAIERVLERRTRHITVVLEDIYHSQNASAVIRSCDCFGLQDMHVIENRHQYKTNPRVVHGASKWVDVYQYKEDNDNSTKCFEHLLDQGYRLVGTVPDQNAMNIQDLSMDEPVALVFGTEKDGLSEKARQFCSAFVSVQMHGFTESFNISVSAALCMNILTEKLHRSKVSWHLSEGEKADLRLRWIKKIVHRSDLLEKEFIKSGNYLT